jgi:magnesium transporter
MFRVLDLREGAVHVSEEPTLAAPPPEGTVRWIDCTGPDAAQLELLRARFDFHPLAIEDCAHFDQRAKVEEYRDHLFVVIHGVGAPPDDPTHLKMQELHAFLGAQYLVTVHDRPMPSLDAVWTRVAGDAALAARGPDFCYYLVADAVVDQGHPVLDRLADELEGLEAAVLTGRDGSPLRRLFRAKHALVRLRKVLTPQRDMLALLARRAGGPVNERTAVYFRDVYDHVVRIAESVETNRDLLGNCFEAYLSMLSQRTNEVMKSLTIMSAVFLPLAFIVGFFGQNFQQLPGMPDWTRSSVLTWTMLAACVLVPGGMLWWFRRRQWI